MATTRLLMIRSAARRSIIPLRPMPMLHHHQYLHLHLHRLHPSGQHAVRSLYSSSSLLLPRSSSSILIRNTLSPLHHYQQQQQHQRRTYLFFPSDWSEVSFRWKLFWEDKTPTQIKIRLQDRYQSQRQRFQLSKHNTKTRIKARYQLSKVSFQRRYQERKLQYNLKASAYYNRLHKYRVQQTQRRREFVKRWAARRSDMVADSRQYYATKYRDWKLTRIKKFEVTEYCEHDWFDPVDGRPLTSLDPTGRYVNPWLSWSASGVHSMTNIFKWRYQRAVREWKQRGWASFLPKDLRQLVFGAALAKETTPTTTTTAPSCTTTTTTDITNPTEIEFTWIGHSTCLVRMGNATILTDPIFSHRCSPFPRMPGVGVARDVPPSVAIDDLPERIDVCLISHDHYDHMDQLSISHLRDRVQHWVLPKGLPQWLETRCSVNPDQMTELEWWQSVHLVQQQPQEHEQAQEPSSSWKIVPGPYNIDDHDDATMTIACCPAQHWSSRTFFDRNKRLWGSFAVETRTPVAQQQQQSSPVVQKFFFAGDTGLPRNGFPLFRQIGDFCGRGLYHLPQHQTNKDNDDGDSEQSANTDENATTATAPPSSSFHPFDLAALPIGAYDPDFLMRDAHMNPQEAVECARQLQTRKAVSIHWGTFALSEEPMEEPPEKLQQVLQLPENQGIVDFVTAPIGGSVTVPAIVDTATTKGDDSSEPLDDTEDDDDDDREVRSVG